MLWGTFTSYEPWAWYSNEVNFSDWRNVPSVDYSTNAIVTDWYSGGHSKYIRAENIEEITRRVNAGERIVLGLDYYALFPISAFFELDEKAVSELRSGGVIVLTINQGG